MQVISFMSDAISVSLYDFIPVFISVRNSSFIPNRRLEFKEEVRISFQIYAYYSKSNLGLLFSDELFLFAMGIFQFYVLFSLRIYLTPQI